MKEVIFNKYLVSLTKIIAIYSFFYVLLKIIAVFKNNVVVPNIILAFPFLLLGLISFYSAKIKNYNWAVVVLGILLICITRYFEADWIILLQIKFNNK